MLLIPLAAAGLIAAHAPARVDGTVARCWRQWRRSARERRSSLEVWNGTVLTAAGDLFRVDALSALMVAIITFLGAIASLYAVGYIRAEFDDAHLSRARLFFALFHLFIFTMLVAVTTDNLGVMWVAIEGTTLGDGLSGQFAPHAARRSKPLTSI